MRRAVVVFLLTVFLAACVQKPKTVELTDWVLDYGGVDYPATIPGFVHTDLMTNGIIPDPFYGTNEDSVQWVGKSKWTYTLKLDRSKLPTSDSLWIVFEGLAGHADIVFYGKATPEGIGLTEIHQSDNMFVRYVYLLPDFAEEIMVQFSPLYDSCLEAEYGIVLPDRRAFTRIAPYQQGWDWGPTLPTCGIWKKVYVTIEHPKQEYSERVATPLPVTLRREQDSIGESFTFYRNGKPVFMKGANWIPVHSFPVDNAANQAQYRMLLCSAKEANFNMLRVWGGGIYEHDYFFDLCDSLGIMVWMDFNFSTMLYPDNEEMLASIDHEARENIRRIARHPCIVLWCGNNEVKNGWEDWGWQEEYRWNAEERRRLEHGIDTIFGEDGILCRAVKECDPLHRPYISTSPLYGWGHDECVTCGDSHYWGVWWGEEPFERYKEKTGRFMSEFGFQSYPVTSSVMQFCPKEQLEINSPTLRSHQKHARGREIIDKAMLHYYGVDSRSLSFDDYAYVSQLLQAWGTGYGIYQHISQQPHCMGTLFWQLNDCWPVASWSSIDYYGNWKALHYRVQALYADSINLDYWGHYYSVLPKDREYPHCNASNGCKAEIVDGKLTVCFDAAVDMYDVFFDTEPHINGHFTRNFFDIKARERVTSTFVPSESTADVRKVKVKVRCLNEIMQRRRP